MSWNNGFEMEKVSRDGHAPRERVSWNFPDKDVKLKNKVTLHVSVWVEIILYKKSNNYAFGHAPRERVSWN